MQREGAARQVGGVLFEQLGPAPVGQAAMGQLTIRQNPMLPDRMSIGHPGHLVANQSQPQIVLLSRRRQLPITPGQILLKRMSIVIRNN